MNLAGHRDRRLSKNYFEPCDFRSLSWKKVRCVGMVEKFLLIFVICQYFVFHDLAQLQKSSHGFVQVSMHKCLFLSKKQACLPIILSCNPATEI